MRHFLLLITLVTTLAALPALPALAENRQHGGHNRGHQMQPQHHRGHQMQPQHHAQHRGHHGGGYRGHHGHHGHHGGHKSHWVAPFVGGAIIGGMMAHQYNYSSPPSYIDNSFIHSDPTCPPVIVQDHYGNRFWARSCHIEAPGVYGGGN